MDLLTLMSSGLENIDGLNALGPKKVRTVRVLSMCMAKTMLAQGNDLELPEEVTRYLEAWDPPSPSPPLPTRASAAETQAPASAPSTQGYAAAATKAVGQPAKPAERTLRPHEGFRTQGGVKGDAEKLAADGGVKDLRTYIRLTPDNQFRNDDPYEIRIKLQRIVDHHCSANGPGPVIERVKKVPSGFSFTPTDAHTPESFAPAHQAIKEALGALKIEAPSPYFHYCLRGIPAVIVSSGRATATTPDLVAAHIRIRFPSCRLAEAPRIISN
ncbi:hypothetical protein V8E36_004311, partial [Tilletia maclaganii]